MPDPKTLSFSREIPVAGRYDVIVAGGGPAGCTAAAAARSGARTLLIEQTGALGGMGTSALVPAWCPFSDKQKMVYTGLAEEVFRASVKDRSQVREGSLDWVPIEAEQLKRGYDELVTGSGARILFNSFLSAVETEDGRVTEVVVSNKHGLSAYRAEVFIDCTGDADLAFFAGARFEKGDPQADGDVQPATHCFILANVDEAAYRAGPSLHAHNPNSPIYQILADGKYPDIPDTHACNNLIGPGCVGFNAGHLWEVDNTEPETVSEALVKGRRMAKAYRDALAEYLPEIFGNSFVVQTGSLMGIRETRRIIGDYVLTLDDYLERRSFEDEICRNSYFIDVHWAKQDAAKDRSGVDEGEKKTFRYGPGETHGIPYRCLVPKDLRNVLVAGRSISCERIVQGSVRVMPVCLAMGQAAGTAAAQALGSEPADVHAIDTAKLREQLKRDGAYLPEPVVPAGTALS